MAIRPVVKLGDELLRKKSRGVEQFDGRLHELLDDMAETMKRENGCGIAAVQVGILRRIFLVDVGNGITEYINPEILEAEGAESASEGCLSIPEHNANVTRPAKVRIRAQNRSGELFERSVSGYEARAVCHENDHLNGILFIDRAEKK